MIHPNVSMPVSLALSHIIAELCSLSCGLAEEQAVGMHPPRLARVHHQVSPDGCEVRTDNSTLSSSPLGAMGTTRAGGRRVRTGAPHHDDSESKRVLATSRDKGSDAAGVRLDA
jgi:hypothetical protein